jgi:hypothetical protein
MKRITLALALAFALAACQTSPDLAAEQQASTVDYCETVGQPLPAASTWAGEALYLPSGSVAIVEVSAQGTFTAHGVDLKNMKIQWVRVIDAPDLGAYHNAMANAGIGVFLRPPPPPCCLPLPGHDVRNLFAEALRVADVPFFQEDLAACQP